jgi:hypothetical protein
MRSPGKHDDPAQDIEMLPGDGEWKFRRLR